MELSAVKPRPVPFVDLQAQHALLRDEILQAVQGQIDRCDFVLGRSVEEFERAFAAYCGVSHCVGVANGTEAIALALRALGVDRPEQEVVVPAMTFVASAAAVVHAGARPVLADIRPETFTLDPSKLEQAITPRTRAIIAVHLYGLPADMEPIRRIARERGLLLIEDAAQAHGARYGGVRVGGLGDAATFSFYPSKNLGACGDGGAVVTSSTEAAARLRTLRDHGAPSKHDHQVIGFNSRLDALQATILAIKLRRLDEWNDLRRAHARAYEERLRGTAALELPSSPPDREHVFHLYVVRVPSRDRDRLREHLAAAGIGHGLHYPHAIHQTRAFAFLGYPEGSFPAAERSAACGLSLPMYPELTESQIDRVSEAVSSYFRGKRTS